MNRDKKIKIVSGLMLLSISLLIAYKYLVLYRKLGVDEYLTWDEKFSISWYGPLAVASFLYFIDWFAFRKLQSAKWWKCIPFIAVAIILILIQLWILSFPEGRILRLSPS